MMLENMIVMDANIRNYTAIWGTMMVLVPQEHRFGDREQISKEWNILPFTGFFGSVKDHILVAKGCEASTG